MFAAVEAIGRTGATDFSFGPLEKDVPIAKARWWAHVRYRGVRIQVEEHVGPIEAIEALVARLLHGAFCLGCGKLTAITDDPVPMPAQRIDGKPIDEKDIRRRGICNWRRKGKHWRRGCGEDAPEGSTREKLARAMAEAGVPAEGIRQARAGYYDEYLSDNPLPLLTLVNDLETNGFGNLAARVRTGEFDATKEESDAWAASPEGQATFAEFMSDVEAGAAARAAAKPAGAGTHTRTDGRRPPWRANRKKTKKGKK